MMTDDWRVDDLALCISRHERYPPEVRPGAVFTVRAVLAEMPDLTGGQPGTGLKFKDVPALGPRAAYCARRSRWEEHTSELQSLLRISYAVSRSITTIPSTTTTHTLSTTVPALS